MGQGRKDAQRAAGCAEEIGFDRRYLGLREFHHKGPLAEAIDHLSNVELATQLQLPSLIVSRGFAVLLHREEIEVVLRTQESKTG